MTDFVARHELDHVVNIADVDGSVWERFGVFGQPTWVFLNAETGAQTLRFGALGASGVLATFEQGGFS